MGIIMTSFSMASILGVPFSLYLANAFSWHAPFIFLGIASLFICGLIAAYIPPIRAHLEGEKVKEPLYRTLTRISQNKNQRRALYFIGAVMFGHFAIIPFLSGGLVGYAGMREHQIALM